MRTDCWQSYQRRSAAKHRRSREIVSALRANGLVIICHAATRVVTELNAEELAVQDELFMG